MDNARKKEIAREYRERPLQAGVFAVVCKPTGQRWISFTRNLDKQQNSVWFQLRMGNHMDDNVLLIDTLLKERVQHWRTQLKASAV